MRGPAIDRKPERGLGNKDVAAHRLEWLTRWVGFRFVIARNDPHFTVVLNSYLGGAENVACRMERKLYSVEREALIPASRFNARPGSQTRAENAYSVGRREVRARTPASMIAVSVRDDRSIDGEPRVDVKVTRFAIKPALG